MAKEKSCLITTSLVGSVNWYLEAPDTIIKPDKGGDGSTTWKQKAYSDLKGMLERIELPFPEVAQRGVNFEKVVYANANLEKEEEIKGSELFIEVCKAVRGFMFYQKGGAYAEIKGNNCYLYCKYDAILSDKTHIKDLKTTASYSKGKQLQSFQHKLYCYVSGAKKFDYITAEWLEYPKIKRVCYDFYEVDSDEKLHKEVIHTIEDCFDVIQDLGLWEAYRTKYCLY